MIHRIVKMEFDPTKVEEFLSNFEENKRKIRAFGGVINYNYYVEKTIQTSFLRIVIGLMKLL